jgi:PIN domain nuclease of toxin-antitoxin system
MKLLLDSHALLWTLGLEANLRRDALEIIRRAENPVFFSAASVWELELKASKGKLAIPSRWILQAKEAGYTELPISASAARSSARLPPHHRDPFDRLLIAQCLEHGLTLATRDRVASQYGIPLLAV